MLANGFQRGDRLAVTHRALASRRIDVERIDGLARRLADLNAGRAVDLSWFGFVHRQSYARG